MLYVIKGLLVREPAVRWGYKQVKKYLEGEHVEIWEHSFSIGGEDCTSFDDIVGTVKNKFPDCKEEIFDGTLGIFLGIHYSAVSKRVKAAVAKAKGMTDDDIAKSLICLALDPESLVLPNGFEAKSLDDVRRLTLQAPETMYKMYWNFNSALYEFLELKGAGARFLRSRTSLIHTRTRPKRNASLFCAKLPESLTDMRHKAGSHAAVLSV